MKDEPPSIATLQPMSPPALDRLICQCLAKDPDDRWQTVRDLTRELRWISQSGSQIALAPAVAARRKKRVSVPIIAAALFAIALAALAMVHFREAAPEAHLVRFQVEAPGKWRLYDTPVLSPDGTQLAFTANTEKGSFLYLRALDSAASKPLPGTEGANFPFWSPDGTSIGFISRALLKKVNLANGAVAGIGEVRAACCGTWSRNGTILFAADSGGTLARVNAAGGASVPLTQPGRLSVTRLWPSFLPDGKHFLYTASSSRLEDRGLWVGSLDSTAPVRLLPDIETNAQYSPPGYLVFTRNDVVFAQPFDAERLRLSGDAIPLAERVSRFFVISGLHFSIGGGNLAYRTGMADAGNELAWFDRAGNRVGTVADGADYSNPALSPDGRLLAVGKRDPSTRKRDLWVYDLARGTSSRLTFDPADELNPTWSPDGATIVFASDRKGPRDLYRRPASGTGPDEPLLESGEDKAPEGWTPDGRFLIYNQGSSRQDIWMLPMAGDRKPVQLLGGSFNFQQTQVSPDGKWIAYVSNESGRTEVYVQNFPPAAGKWPISSAGGLEPQWSRDGKELFYVQGSQLMAVGIKESAGRFDATVPKALFTASLRSGGRNRYLVSPDGKRFLVTLQTDTDNTLPMNLVLNWQAGLKR